MQHIQKQIIIQTPQQIKIVSNVFLNVNRLSACRMLMGREFQSFGPATLKERSAKVVSLVKGIFNKTPSCRQWRKSVLESRGDDPEN